MVEVEGHEPVAQGIEEWETLHLLKATEIYVYARLLHVHHLSDALLHLLHAPVLGTRVENILNRSIIVLLSQSEMAHAGIGVLHDVGNDGVGDVAVVFLGLRRVVELHGHFKQIVPYLRLLEQGVDDIVEQAAEAGVGTCRKHPSH